MYRHVRAFIYVNVSMCVCVCTMLLSKRSCHLTCPWAQRRSQQLSLSEGSGSMSVSKLAGAILPDQKIALDNDERGGLSSESLGRCPIAWYKKTYLLHWHGLGPVR